MRPNSQQFRLLLAGLVAAACGCAKSHQATNVMHLLAVCDSVPPPRTGLTPVVPTIESPALPFGALVGAVAETDTHAALGYATIDLARLDGAVSGRLLAADANGGFVVEGLEPGTYRVRVRSFNHRFVTQDVRIASAAVETLLVVLRYYRCSGY